MQSTWPCPVCGYHVFYEPPGSYEICDVCGWEDCPVQIKHPRIRGGPNGGSVFDYQQNMSEWRPGHDLHRDPGWRSLLPDEALLDSGKDGEVNYRLDSYNGKEPYYFGTCPRIDSARQSRR